VGALVTFKNLSVTRFLEELDYQNFFWIVKRLSGNDTGLTGGHQAGLYLPRVFFEATLPEICTTEKYNPDVFIKECFFPAQDFLAKNLRAIYYNSKYFPERDLKKKYDEFLLTRWGGNSSPVQDEENTGSICVFAVKRFNESIHAVAWVASSIEEENIIENWLGEEVEPGRFCIKQLEKKKEKLPEFKFPPEWLQTFPSGKDIFNLVVKLIPRQKWKKTVDDLLLKRRELEFQVFEQIELTEVLPQIKDGFSTVEDFIKYAHSVSNRRKSRTGTSLELNLEAIFIDEDIAFETQVITENRKKPDFLFPSGKAYHSMEFPNTRLHMLASKTCCKDRWRQILNEADKVFPKHLFTLQEGVSGNQLQEMKDNNVALVIPKPHFNSFPKEWHNSLLTLKSFIDFIKNQQAGIENLSQWTN